MSLVLLLLRNILELSKAIHRDLKKKDNDSINEKDQKSIDGATGIRVIHDAIKNIADEHMFVQGILVRRGKTVYSPSDELNFDELVFRHPDVRSFFGHDYNRLAILGTLIENFIKMHPKHEYPYLYPSDTESTFVYRTKKFGGVLFVKTKSHVYKSIPYPWGGDDVYFLSNELNDIQHAQFIMSKNTLVRVYNVFGVEIVFDLYDKELKEVYRGNPIWRHHNSYRIHEIPSEYVTNERDLVYCPKNPTDVLCIGYPPKGGYKVNRTQLYNMIPISCTIGRIACNSDTTKLLNQMFAEENMKTIDARLCDSPLFDRNILDQIQDMIVPRGNCKHGNLRGPGGVKYSPTCKYCISKWTEMKLSMATWGMHQS